jgi:hypothetical protein
MFLLQDENKTLNEQLKMTRAELQNARNACKIEIRKAQIRASCTHFEVFNFKQTNHSFRALGMDWEVYTTEPDSTKYWGVYLKLVRGFGGSVEIKFRLRGEGPAVMPTMRAVYCTEESCFGLPRFANVAKGDETYMTLRLTHKGLEAEWEL